jgi:hypothetical protein
MRLILPSLAVSAAVLAAVFTFLYLPQAAVLSVVQLGGSFALGMSHLKPLLIDVVICHSSQDP